MNDTIPFCERCGRVGARLSGAHPDDDGLVRWTLYSCGHVTTTLTPDASSAPQSSAITAPI